MRRALLAVLVGLIAFLVIEALYGALQAGTAIDLGYLVLSPPTNPVWAYGLLALLRSAQIALPALLSGWVLGKSSTSARMALLAGLAVGVGGAALQSALGCGMYGCSHLELNEVLFRMLVSSAEVSIPAPVAAYAGMRLRQR